jgi:hypothetical protein
MTDGTGVPTVPELSRPEVVSRVRGAGVPALVDRDGAVLIRDAGVTTAAALATLAIELGLSAVDQLEPFAPRRDLGHGVWSQLAWPSTSPMCMHHELGWQGRPPAYLLVACLRPPTSGGRTGVADGRAVLSLLPDRLVDRAVRHGWLLVRRYAGGLFGMPWEQAFPGLDRDAVTAYAATEGIDLAWESGGLITRRHRPAVRPTGTDGAPAWSNLLAFCSEWTMDPAVRDFLVATAGRSGLQFETAYGDGSPFPAADVTSVHAAYDRATARVAWRAGDVLLLDNVRTAHAVEPYTGEREMAVMHATAAIGS